MIGKFPYKYVTIIISFILLELLFSNDGYELNNSWNEKNNNSPKKLKACIIILVRNKDFNRVINLIRQVDLTFNNKTNYPYVIFNNEEFSNEFKNNLQNHTNSKIELKEIPKNFWSVPNWIDKKKLNESLKEIGASVDYRHMCRFYSGFFFRLEVTLKYDYFMRLDTDSAIFEIEEIKDPFEKLKNDGIGYGFLLTTQEGLFTIPTLWNTIKQWAHLSNIDFNIEKQKGLSFITDDNGKSLNKDLCIFYNNFEMGDFSYFRTQDYLDFFNFLDKSGGFYYERWGDAPIHTYYFLIRLELSKIYRFKEITYKHAGLYSSLQLTRKDPIKLDNCVNKWEKIANFS